MRRLLGALLAVALVHAGAMLAWRALHDRQVPSGRLVPAAEGGLDALAIQFHRQGAERFLPVFGQILTAVDPDTAVHVVVGEAEDQRVFEEALAGWFPAGDGPTVDYTSTGHPITSWMRDRLAVTTTSDGPLLLAPLQPMTGVEARVNDWMVPWTLGEHLALPVRTARYRFDGGDLIAERERAFVASPLLARNPGRDPAELLAELEADLGLPVTWVGSHGEPVPDHHIGMFLTPLGGGRVAVGDPDLALDALGDALEPGDPVLQVDSGALRLDLAPERLERFRRVGEQLRTEGFQVVPVPVLPSSEPFVFLSYNNALLDQRDGRLHVVLPVYGVDALDAAATSAWEGAGAVVHPVDVSGVFRLGGSVRCLVAPLHRTAA